jgi:hypothetical protein
MLRSRFLDEDGASLLKPGGPVLLLLKFPITSLLILIFNPPLGADCGLLPVESLPPLSLSF